MVQGRNDKRLPNPHDVYPVADQTRILAIACGTLQVAELNVLPGVVIGNRRTSLTPRCYAGEVNYAVAGVLIIAYVDKDIQSIVNQRREIGHV